MTLASLSGAAEMESAMPKLDVTLTLAELQKLILRLEIERGEAFRDLQWSDQAIALKALQSRRKALQMAVACVQYVAKQS